MNLNSFIQKLEEMNISLNENQLNQLEQYYEILVEENEKYNLTNITEKEEVYLKHFYDSITISKIIDINNINSLCDIGTGAGFPGLVLKIIFPNVKIILVDSLNKRINFLNKVIETLDLKNIETYHERAEDFSIKNIEKYDVVTARAVSHLSNILEYSIQCVKINGYFVAMKANCDEEIKESKNALNLLNCSIENIVKFNLPYEESLRTLIKIKKEKSTNKKYPRKFSEIKKNRL